MKKSSEKLLRDVELRGLRRLTAGQVHHRAPAWSPDGRWLCLEAGEGRGSAWLICDSKGRAARALEGPAEGGASFSPDNGLAYGRRVGATIEIWQLASGGQEPRQLLGGDGRLYRDPAYSPDGRWLCYAADEEGVDSSGRARLWLLDLHDGTHAPLPVPDESAAFHLGRPAWDPAGERIYFEASRGGELAIYALEVETRRLRRVTDQGRRPAPLGGELLLIEREHEDGSSGLSLIDHSRIDNDNDNDDDDDDDGEVRERRLTERARCAREPAVVCRKGEVQVACAMLCRPDNGEPQRYDLYVGRLAGLPRLAGRRAEER